MMALDACAAAQADFEAAARLAAGLEAELVGLLVEDAALIAAADLPVTRLVPAGCRELAALDGAAMRRALRVAEAQARERLAQAAKRWRLTWSFEVAAAAAARDAMARLERDDLLALTAPRAAWRPAQVPCPVMLQRRGGRHRQPVVLVHEGDALALGLAADLARANEARLLILTGDPLLGAEALDWLAGRQATAALEPLSEAGCERLARRLSGLYPSAIVYDRRGKLGACLDPDQLAEGADAVVVVG